MCSQTNYFTHVAGAYRLMNPLIPSTRGQWVAATAASPSVGSSSEAAAQLDGSPEQSAGNADTSTHSDRTIPAILRAAPEPMRLLSEYARRGREALSRHGLTAAE